MRALRQITFRRAMTAALASVMTIALLPAASMGYNEPPKELKRAEWKALAEINHLRADRGLKPLRMAHRVRLVARDRSRDMRNNRYFGHASPTGRDAAALLARRNVRYFAGSENIGWVTFLGWKKAAASIADAWFDSPGHRANLLSSEYNYVGIGAARAGKSIYWTAIFVRQLDHTAPKAGLVASDTGLSVASGAGGRRSVTIRWWGRDRVLQRNTAGLKGFTVQKRTAMGTWRTLRHLTSKKHLTLSLSRGTHRFRVRAIDNRGNRSNWRRPLTVTVY
ncbi:MAG: CAP domain-containing protein [Chloroflexota bacterium]